jgi:hypothetical protein
MYRKARIIFYCLLIVALATSAPFRLGQSPVDPAQAVVGRAHPTVDCITLIQSGANGFVNSRTNFLNAQLHAKASRWLSMQGLPFGGSDC